MTFWGIDYGSKLAGTTVIAAWKEEQVTLMASRKKQDADAMILELAAVERPDFILLDAPLSLPNVYLNEEGYDDFFYRKLDRIVGGMSPMFLGGLTARAMRLKQNLTKLGIPVYETYPALHARHFDLKSMNYKKQVAHIPPVVDFLSGKLPFSFDKIAIKSWHHVDGLLALYSAYRYFKNEHEMIGDEAEGFLYH